MKKRIDAYNIVISLRKKENLGRRRLYKVLNGKGYNIPPSTIHGWLNGRKPNLKEFSKKSKNLTREKAFVLGVIGPGDGFIVDSKNEIALSVIDYDFASEFKRCLEKTYACECKENILKPTGFGKNPRFKISLYSKNAVIDLNKYNVSFKEKDWSVPSAIKLASNELKSDYIRGIADSQGSVGKREILIASKNLRGLIEVKQLLSNLNMRSSIQNRKDTSILSISSRQDMELFAQKVNFSICRKREKLKQMLQNYKRFCNLTEAIDMMIPEIEKYITKGYSVRKVARICGISTTAISSRINKRK